MHDVLCIYYSRTGNTKKAMQEIAAELDAELVELSDGVNRKGFFGWLRCGMDAMRKNTRRVRSVKLERPLTSYRLVVVGTPVWAGRCSSVVRSFLKERGKELQDVAYVLTRASEDKYEEVYEQMDLYVPRGHRAVGSLRPGSVGYDFWKEEFLRQAKEFLESSGR